MVQWINLNCYVWYSSNVTSRSLEIFCRMANASRADLLLYINGLYIEVEIEVEKEAKT